jgi:hypothetical protein
LLKSWIGHSSNSDDTTKRNDITVRYDFSASDRAWRQSWANKVGIGFDLPAFKPGHPEPDPTKPPKSRKQSKTELRTQLLGSEIAESYEQAYVAQDSDLPESLFDPPVPTAEVR